RSAAGRGVAPRQDRGGPAPARRPPRLPALHDRPAVVAAALNAVDHLPQLPADVADPQVAGDAVEAHAPGIAEAVGPDLGPRSGGLEEWIVGRDRVGLARLFAVHVDAKDR